MSKPFIRPFPRDWYTRRYGWAAFMVRELTCVGVAFYTLLVILLVWKHGQGERAYLDFLECVQSPTMILVHGFMLLLLVFHSVTWFVATPKAVAIRVPWTGEKVPDDKVIGGNVGACVAVTIACVWFVCFYLAS